MMRRNKGVAVFRRLFLSHPQSVGESYFQHQRVALSFAFPLLAAPASRGLCSMPLSRRLAERTAGDTIRKLHGRLEKRG